MADCARALATAALLLFGPVCNGGSKDRLATTNASNVRRPAGLASLSRQSGQAGIDRTDELEQYGSGPPGKRITTRFRPPGRVANSSACRCNADRDDISRRSRSLQSGGTEHFHGAGLVCALLLRSLLDPRHDRVLRKFL